MNTVTSKDLYSLSSNPLSAAQYDGYEGTPAQGVYGLGMVRTSRRGSGFGAMLGDLMETLKKPVVAGIPLWGLLLGGVAAVVVLPALKKR